MRSNNFGSMILGTIVNGQGSIVAVAGAHRVAALRKLAAKFKRGLVLRLDRLYALALSRVSVVALAAQWRLMPATATCRMSTTRRDQRNQRWMPGVVVAPGTVGVC